MRRSPLLDLDGAVGIDSPDPAGEPDLLVPAHFGNPLREQALLAEGRAVVALARDVVAVSGPDRLSWLTTLSSQVLTGLAPGDGGAEALLLDAQGHITHALAAVDDGETLFLVTQAGDGPVLADFLDSMRFMLAVQVCEREELAVLGAHASGLAAQELAGLEAGTVPVWVRLTAALALAAGTAAGGLRIIRTLGSGIAEVDPAQGFAAQSVSAVVLYATALTSGAPVSTTYTVASSITGAALVRGRRRVNWGTVGRIAMAWLVTLPAAALLGGVATTLLVGLARLAG